MALRLTLAISPYDHVADLVTGAVRPKGIDLECLILAVEDLFQRYIEFRHWEVSETPFGQYAALVSQGDRSLVGIPVFPCRVFRHSAMYVRRGAGIRDPRLLMGKRVGIPEWAQTACIYARGVLTDYYGVALNSIDWYQGGVNEAGRREHVRLQLPHGVRCTAVPDRSLNEMLLSGDLDAVISARPPDGFSDGQLIRLFEDPHTEEERYWRDTGVFPIMHVVSVRGDVYERDPWVALELFRAFDEARRRSVERLFDLTASRVPVAWPAHEAQQSAALFGDEYWPYGIARNATTLDAFLRLAYEHGVCARRLTPAELFPPEFSAEFRV